ncbi:MAG: hypothetical protein ACRD19_01655 [Terriglobia bacterium]
MSKFILVLGNLFLLPLAPTIMAQPAPARSDGLCTALRKTASERALKFTVTSPGACMLGIDKGYNLVVSYNREILNAALGVNAVLLNGNASAFWLRLSAFDNLVHLALGTKQEIVFDQMNKLASKMARESLTGKLAPGQMIHSKAEKATLGAVYEKGIIFLIASADVKDIDAMKRKLRHRDQKSTLRRVLSLSLQAFAAGAQGYAREQRSRQRLYVQQPIYSAPRTCYTNFLGNTVFTSCY